MKDAKVSSSKDKYLENSPFAEVVEAVFLFIHKNYADFSAILRGHGINYSQYTALLTIYMYDNLSEGELAKLLFINPSSISRMMYALENKEWVKGTRDQVDRRKVMIALTPTGRLRMEAMKNMQAEVLNKLVQGLDAEKRGYVYDVAELVNQALRYLTNMDTPKNAVSAPVESGKKSD